MTVILAAVLGAIVAVSLSPLAKWLYEKTAPYRHRRAANRGRTAEAKRYWSPRAVEQRRLAAKKLADGKAFGENVNPWWAQKFVAEREAKESDSNDRLDVPPNDRRLRSRWRHSRGRP